MKTRIGIYLNVFRELNYFFKKVKADKNNLEFVKIDAHNISGKQPGQKYYRKLVLNILYEIKNKN